MPNEIKNNYENKFFQNIAILYSQRFLFAYILFITRIYFIRISVEAEISKF